MRRCPECQTAVSQTETCPACGAELDGAAAETPVHDAEPVPDVDSDPTGGPDIADADANPVAGGDITDADYDPEAERERFQRRFGIDIGDRTVDEYLDHLDQQDYSPTPWFWLLIVTEIAGIILAAATLFDVIELGVEGGIVFAIISVALAALVFADTRVVGQFERWAKIRWTYILMSAIPVIAHLTGIFYLLLRRLKHEQAVEYRRRLMNAGFDIGFESADD
ncbi:hypothetical protein ACFQJ5_17635 [Halomicroarcula sp. GCM10025324]|uniref:hypothetical protein n=1 Tax=Haloarcula TaxID=2237 RepID=UPI0023E78F81|nr:hypothetical protein [Halomicroarcula sp. ZS-22-S1]